MTMRAASSLVPRAISLSSAPKPTCVAIFGWIVTGNSSGTPIRAACRRRSPPAANGTRLKKARSFSGGSCKPSNASHSWPGRMFMAARKVSICAGVIRPEWLSLWPAKGRPAPLIV